MLKNALTGIIAFFVALLVAEAILWIFPVPDPYAQYKKIPLQIRYIRSQYPTNYHITIDCTETLPGFENYQWPVLFKTNNVAMRAPDLNMPKPADEYRIFAVGGSTTECMFLHEDDAWPNRLQAGLNDFDDNIRVYNCGKSGDATVDHIELLALRLVHFQPDMVILFAGFNDLTRLLFDDNRLDFDNPSDLTPKIPFWRLMATELQFPRRVYYALKKHNEQSFEVFETINLSERAAKARATKVSQDPLNWLDTAYYRSNLETIAGICRQHNIRLLFVTQPDSWLTKDSLLAAHHWMFGRGPVAYPKRLVHHKLTELNEIMKQVAVNNAIPCFDAANALPPDTTVFYDDCHFNPNGSKLMAARLKDFILDNHILQKTNPTDN